jgi:hypothetical protein
LALRGLFAGTSINTKLPCFIGSLAWEAELFHRWYSFCGRGALLKDVCGIIGVQTSSCSKDDTDLRILVEEVIRDLLEYCFDLE